MNKPQAIYRKDYQPSAYLIYTTELSFDLSENQTIVNSTMHFYKNPLSTEGNNLFLNGVDLELLAITINNATPDYQLLENGLKISNLADEFILKITTRIHPEKNTSLNGLYQSNGNFCSQCEAHGFRQISYYLDRPDVLSIFTTHIKAEHDKYPVLLSNGNLVSQSNGTATWHDPIPKPCYLFALVAGNFAVLEDSYNTINNNQVALKIYVEPHNISKTQFAMAALKRSFAWDEARFGLAYDLDIYMIVAVDDFNMGAMENKGLNIFNSTYVLANPDTATDADFISVEAVIGHEYFHNWTGNRVSCQDWFQLSLKEGLTVFREQEFTADLHSRSSRRIEDVDDLRTFQFAEDRGPMQHPVRPERYIEMNNFYTATVYEKGAEVIRMIHTLLGEARFQRGMKLYFQRYDGQAVTIDDFIGSMSDANNFDFSQFMLWYSQAGTPKVSIQNNDNIITISQNDARLMPIKYGVLDAQGIEIENGVLVINSQQQQFDFSHLPDNCTFSWLRDFSAPIKLNVDLSIQQKIFLCEYDTDAFSRWDKSQDLWSSLILNADTFDAKDEAELFAAFAGILQSETDNTLTSEMLSLPSESLLHLQVDEIDVPDIAQKRKAVIDKIIQHFQPLLLKTYTQQNTDEDYQLTPESVGKRALKNTCLYYLVRAGEFELAYKQFNNANCMTDRLAAFNALLLLDNPYQVRVIEAMFADYQNDVQVMDKWFAVQAIAPSSNVETIKKLMQHPLFSFNTPNRLRSVIGNFTQNFVSFHSQQSYQLFTDVILKLNISNPQIGARLVSTYNHWRRFTPELKALQKQQLETILATKNLSNDIFEIVQAALK